MKKYIAYIGLLAGLSACNKTVFDKADLTGVTPDVVWANESTANLYINKTYDLVMPAWPSGTHNTSDETNNTGSSALLYGQLTMNDIADIYGASGTGFYSNVYRCNLTREGIASGSMPADAKARLNGQNYFLRAYLYFSMVKLYGGVPLVLKTLDYKADNLNVSRSKTSVCIDSIVRDLDSCTGLPTSWGAADKGRITRGAALALKGKVLLFWASQQFNPTNDAARWERAYQANRAAYDTLVKDGFALYPTFANIFMDETSVNKEPIIIRSYDLLNKTTNIENNTRPYSESTSGGGSNQPTLNLVKAFPMKNGLAITDVASGYDPVYYWKNRDPRFDATVAYNGVVWALSQKAGRKEWIYTKVKEDLGHESSTGFYNRKMCNVNVLAANAAIGNGTDWIEMRLAEVMLNLAECANATGRQSEAYTMLYAIRARAGIPSGGGTYGLKAAMTQTEMFTAIMAERQIEFAFEGKRYDDLRRTKLWTTLNGTVRNGLSTDPKSPHTVAELETKDAFGVMLRDKLDLNGVDYTNYFTTKVTILDQTYNINFLDNYYFYAMPLSALQSNPAIQQTVGWPGGVFDPLQ